ncbi:MAG: fibronectin type III domain-containing protein [Calditrichaeota bacterium]|nr:fibronectin type III domain-containing protein [Calditrichota bacterium]
MKFLLPILLLFLTIGFISCDVSDNSPTGAANETLSKPEDLVAIALSDSQVYLTWVDTNSFESGFYIQYLMSDASDWEWIDTLEANADSFTDNNLEEGSQYSYRIIAYNETHVSELSNVAIVTTLAKVPTDLTAEQDSLFFTTIRLSWVDASLKETGYKVQRKLKEDDIFEDLADIDPNETEYLDDGLDINQRYYYRVCAMIDSVGSHWSNEVSKTTVPFIVPPSNLIATALSDNQIYLSWVDSSLFETGFRVQKLSDDSTAWTVIGEPDRETTEWLDTGLNEGSSYRYRVRTLGRESVSDPSEVATAKTWAFPPSNLVAVQDSVLFTKITLTWIDLSEKETGYQIQRKLGSRGIYEVIVELDADIEEYLDEGLDQNTTYFYQVRAVIDTVGSTWSNEAGANTTVLTPRPPTNLEARPQSANSINLHWTDNSFNNNGFILERSLQEHEDWDVTDTLEYESLQTYTVEDLSENTTYYFRIAAYNTYGNSAYSNVASATTPPEPPNAPSNLRMDSVTYEVVNLAWDDNSNNETGFLLQRKVDSSPRWDDHAEIDQNLSVFNDTDVVMNTEYHYRIKAVNDAGSSAYSNELIVATPNGPPYPPSFTAIETRSISNIFLIWTPHPYNNHIGFYLERKSEHEDNFTQVGGELYEISYTDTDLDPDTWYTYRVYAFNEIGRSDYSIPDSAQTWTTAVFSEGFEDYDVDEIPPEPWEVDERGGSTARISDTDHHDGSLCLEFQDTNDTPRDSASCRATIATRPVEKGNIECWLKIADDGYLGMMGGDPNNFFTFRLQFCPDNLLLFHHQGVMLAIEDCFPTDEWFKLTVVFDVNAQSYDLLVNDEEKVENARLQRNDHEGNSKLLIFTFINATLTYANLDDMVVNDTIEDNMFIQYSEQSSYEDNGDVRIDNVNMIVETDQ